MPRTHSDVSYRRHRYPYRRQPYGYGGYLRDPYYTYASLYGGGYPHRYGYGRRRYAPVAVTPEPTGVTQQQLLTYGGIAIGALVIGGLVMSMRKK